MKRFYITAILAFCIFAGLKAADFPTLYIVGEFNGWNIDNPERVNAGSNGVYTVNWDSGRARKFKMSFTAPVAHGEFTAWNAFDEGAFGMDGMTTWQRGIYKMQSNIANSELPGGAWVITVYYDEQMVALSAPGEAVPKPGDYVNKDISGTLPVLYINVYDENGKLDNEVIDYNLSHKDYFAGKYWLDLNGCTWLEKLGAKSIGSADEPLDLQIKARGNYTRTGFSKKPFKLKLDKKQSLLGLSKSKHFAIMAHADDNRGFLRNFVGFELGKRIGLPWTPTHQPVEVIINGNYRGLYFLTESIRIDEDRVNIREGADNELEKEYISGGYIVELDNYPEDDDAQIRMAEKSCVSGHNLDELRITFDTPEVYSDLQRRFITEQFTNMNNAIGRNSDEIWTYMDLDDAARYYLVKEIVGDTEAYHGSTYLFRDHGYGQKWHFSPLWDFGNAFNSEAEMFFYNNDPFGNTWIPSLRENAKFNQKVRETWLWFMSNKYDGLTDDINAYIDHIEAAASYDNSRWTSGVPQPSQSSSDIQNRKNNVLDYLNRRINWLKRQFGDFTATTFSEPERDNTPAAPLPDYAMTGVEQVVVEGTDNNVNRVWYNLQGQPIKEPVKGNIYITPQGLIRF